MNSLLSSLTLLVVVFTLSGAAPPQQCPAPPVTFVTLEVIEKDIDKLEKLSGPFENGIEDVRQSKEGDKIKIEYLKATIKPEHLNKGSDVSDKMRKLMQEKGGFGNKDDAGHIIGKALGGPGNQEYNLFPQLATINRGPYNQMESISRDYLKGGGPFHVIFSARLVYNDDQHKLRPSSVLYNMRAFVNGNQMFCEINDEMLNPLPN